MSNKYKDQAQDILTAVGGVENIVDVTYDTKCITIHMQHTIPSTANEVKQIVDVTSVAENDANTDNINSQDTSYTPQVKVTTPILVKAPIAGRRILLKEVRDSIFREKMVGEGLAIKAHEESKVIAPVNGLISMIVPTKHAVGIQSEDGVDIVIHIGVNTVDLEGKGFKCFVKQNDRVEAGQTLLQFDQQYIQQQGYNADVIVVISNSADLGKVELTMNEIITTEDVIFKIFKN
ncbi:TPA: PTS glucose transporter subunit IIA [Staphylococcus aureus]|nr:PTS glucose transporter subunit IIA [Staphylococcus aureus]